ncbi:MAG: C25 family cysteine peptidase, partial [Chloroflexota bacterium]
MSNLSRIRLRRVWLPLFVALMAANIGTLAQAQTSSPLRLLQSDANRVVVELAVPSYAARQQTVDGAPFTVLSLPDFGHSDTPGEPQLPTKGTLIGVPPGAEPSLRVLDDDATTTTIAFPPLPAPTTLAQFDPNQLLPAYGGKVFAPNAATYSADRFMPADAAQLRAVGNWRSQRYALLQFAPLQYNPASHQLIFHRRLRVEITFTYPRGKTPTALGAPLDEGAFEPILQHALLNYDSAKNWRARDMPQPQLPQQSSVSTSGGPWYKIAIADDGIYQLACQQLADAGINVATLNVSTLKIFKQGVELAIQVVGAWSGTCSANDLIVFFAQAARTRYTNTNIYWLTFDGAPGKRMDTRDGSGVGATPTVFTESVHLENDRQYIQSPVLNETDDKWYWFNMPNAYDPDGNGDANSADFGIHLDGVASGAWAATLDVRLFGFQAAAHHTQVFVNNNVIGDLNWYGIATSDTALSFPQAYLNPITNTIRISEELGVIFVNNFDIGYARTFTATNDALRFRQTTNGAWRYQISGFVAPSITAFDITDPYNVTRIVNASVAPSGGTYSLSFADALPAPREYIALADAQRKIPLSLTADAPSSLASASNGADYIIIAYGGFIPNAMPLANFRAAQGLRVKVVDAQDVYDEFSDGLMDAQAVHNFLQYAYTNWQAPAPSFVLLVGDGNFDFKNNYGTGEPNFIPPYLLKVDPWIGETASDNRFVAFNLTNALPSMAIGRLPADNAADVDAMVSKILNYEQNPPP